MKKFFNKCITSCLVFTTTLIASAGILSTNVADQTTGPALLSTNRALLYQLEFTATASSVIDFYDQDTLAAPYYGTNIVISSGLVTRSSYVTNIASSYVGYNGYTNWYTNSGIWFVNTTNSVATTNALTPTLSFVVGPNVAVTYAADAIFSRGVVMRVRSGTNVNAVIYTRSGQ